MDREAIVNVMAATADHQEFQVVCTVVRKKHMSSDHIEVREIPVSYTHLRAHET